MSTSDAGELGIGIGGGETATPLHGTAQATRTKTAREQDETFSFETFKQENHGDETPMGQQSPPSAIRQDRSHKALILRADGVKEPSDFGDSKVQPPKPIEPTFTSCLFLKLNRISGLDKSELRLERNLAPFLHSLNEIQRATTDNSRNLINGQTSTPDTSIKKVSYSPLSERIQLPVKKKEDIIAVDCNELETNRELRLTHSFSVGDSGPHESCGLNILQCGSQPKTFTKLVELEDNLTKLVAETDLGELSTPTTNMLSSSVVTVLAPHWSGRLRRNKRFEGTGSLEAQGNVQDGTNTSANLAHERCQETPDRSLTDGSQAQLRAPFLTTTGNTMCWTTKYGPGSLDYVSRRKMNQTGSLDATSGRMDNRKIDASPSSTVATTESPLSPLSLNPNEQRRIRQTGHLGGLSSSSTKPTTSSLLLSLRRLNSNGRNPASNLSEINPSPLSNSPSDQDVKLSPTPLPQTFHNNNLRDGSKPLLSPISSSYLTTETGPILSLSSSTSRERTQFEKHFFPNSPINKDAENSSFIHQPQIIHRAQSRLLCSKQAFLSRGPLEKQEDCRCSDKITKLFSERSVCSPKHSPSDPSAGHHPRRTTLTSTSWWKQVTQEGSSPLIPNDTTNIKDKLNTPLVSPCNDNTGLASPSPTYNKVLSCPTPNNITEPICKGSMNLVMKTQGGTYNLKERNAQGSPGHESDRFVQQQYGSNLNSTELQKPQSLPDVVSGSKISRATPQTTLSHAKDFSRDYLNKSSFTINVTESPSTLLSPKSPQTPTESSCKYNTHHCTSQTNSNPAFPHNKDPQKCTKPPLSLTTPNTLNSQALTCKAASGRSITTITKTSSSFHSYPVSSQTNALSYTRSSSPTSKFIPKNNCIPVSTSSTSSSSTTGSHLTPLVTPALPSSPTTVTVASLLTPPATPNIISPNHSDTSIANEAAFSSIKDPKKLSSCVERKKARKVTWEDSLDQQHSEPITLEKSEPSQVPTSPSAPRSSQTGNAPSIFTFLRSSSPTTNKYPLCSPTTIAPRIQVVKGGEYRSLSSDSTDLLSTEPETTKQIPSDTILDKGRGDETTPRHERTLSVESSTDQCHSSAPLSLPPEISSPYKLRYSSPPYSTLMSTRSTQVETKPITPKSQLFQQPLNVTPHISIQTVKDAAMTLPMYKPSFPPISIPQPLSLPFHNKTVLQESSKCGVSETNQVNNNNGKKSKDCQNGQILLVNNKVHVSSQPLQGGKILNLPSKCVTETLVYSIKSKVDTVTADSKNTTPKPLKHTADTMVVVETKLGQRPHTVQINETTDKLHLHLDQHSSGCSSTDSQPSNDESCNRRMKENIPGQSRFLSVESNTGQSPKRKRFAMKKGVGTPSSSLSRSESERANKTNNKVDQVINRLKQTFSTRRSDDDILFPWKWKRASQPPSVSGSSDISNVIELTVESTKTLEEPKQEKEMVPKDKREGTKRTNICTQNRYTLIPSSPPKSTVAGDKFPICSKKSTPKSDQDEQNACVQHMSESENQLHLTTHRPTTNQFVFCKSNSADFKPSTHVHSSRDLSPGRSPNLSPAYPAQVSKSPSSPRSPFSPFASLSPFPFPSLDATDDSVFYSPKVQRRRESLSPHEPGEGISLGGSRRSRASTGPPTVGPGQDKECLSSSCADLKYGIEPGRTFSVSSVLSSRPSGTGRISTGSRFLSMSDLSKSASTCGSTRKDLDQWTVTPDWTTEYDCQTSKDCIMSCFPSDLGKIRSKSLPRSLTRRLANSSSGIFASPHVSTTPSLPSQHWSPVMNTCDFAWDTEGPPTPPPTPPLSPVSRRLSNPPSLSSPTLPSSSGLKQQVESQCSRGHLPSRGYRSSLSTFEESSDSSSDTTTDDEYYLETGEVEEKETEL